MVMRSERRERRKRHVCSNEFAGRKGVGLDTPDPSADGQPRTELIHLLDGLEERWRAAVALHFLEGLTQREVASRLGVSQQMVSRRIQRGLRLLRVAIT
jgi:RNA polymerase sigma-70 factor (ECF subfamily)